MPSLTCFRFSRHILGSRLVVASLMTTGFLLGGCSWFVPGSPASSATPEPSPVERGRDLSANAPTTISQVISSNGQPVGLTLADERVLRFATPQAKLYTDPLAFQAAVAEGIGGFLLSPVEPAWADICGELTELPSHLAVENTDKLREMETNASVWQACQLGDQWLVLSSVKVGAKRAEQPMWLALPAHPEWQSELQRVQWSLELVVR